MLTYYKKTSKNDKKLICPSEITIMKNNTTDTLYAINTRIDRDLAARMNELIGFTKKSTAAFVQDAIIEYLNQVFEKKL